MSSTVALVDQRREALERLLASRALHSRPRLREFLRYVGDAALDGRSSDAKENTIGVAVFGRPAHYSVSDDTIVRVTARQLRQKIDEYYAEEGRADPWRVVIPRGTYLPSFEETETAELPVAAPRRGPLRWQVAAGVAILVAVAVWWLRPRSPEPSLMTWMQQPPGQRIVMVYGDALVQLYKQLTGWAPQLADYQSGAFLNSPELRRALGGESKLWDLLRRQPLPANGSLQLPLQLARAVPVTQLLVRHPRDVQVREFSDDNVILLSGPFSNPWVQLFEGRLNFRIAQDAPGNVFIRNVQPLAGELAEYRPSQSGADRTTYGRLAYLPNLSGRGRVLMIGGPSAALMEIMGFQASNPEFLRGLGRRLGIDPARELPWCELLMELKEVAHAPVRTRIVAVRRIP